VSGLAAAPDVGLPRYELVRGLLALPAVPPDHELAGTARQWLDVH
jgi:hypothetical protein